MLLIAGVTFLIIIIIIIIVTTTLTIGPSASPYFRCLSHHINHAKYFIIIFLFFIATTEHMITSLYFLAAKSQSKQPVTKETDTEVTPLTKDIGKKEELLFEYNKFQKRWMDQLSDLKNRKP